MIEKWTDFDHKKCPRTFRNKKQDMVFRLRNCLRAGGGYDHQYYPTKSGCIPTPGMSNDLTLQCPGLAPKRLPLPAATLVSLILIPCLTCLEPKGLISNFYIIISLFHYVILFYNYHSIIIFVVHVILLLYMISMFSYHCVIRLI